MTLWKKVALVALLLLFLLVTQLNLNLFQSEWNHSGTAVTAGREATGWTTVWVVPEDTGMKQTTDQLAKELITRLETMGLNARLAPAQADISERDDLPIVLFLSVAEWKTSPWPFSRQATVRAALRSQSVGEESGQHTQDNVWINQDFSGSGRYRGLITTRKMNEDMAEQVLKSFTKTIYDQLHKRGRAVSDPSIKDTNGKLVFKWRMQFSLGSVVERLFGSKPNAGSQTTLANQKPLYEWSYLLDDEARYMRIYRVQASGEAVEQELLAKHQEAAAESESGPKSFGVLDYNGYHRRTVRIGDVFMAHWNPKIEGELTVRSLSGYDETLPSYVSRQAEVMDRYVVVIGP